MRDWKWCPHETFRLLQDSVLVSHTWAKNNLSHQHWWSPSAVYMREQACFIIYSTVFPLRKAPREQSVIKECLLGFPQSSMERPAGFSTSSCKHVSKMTSQSLKPECCSTFPSELKSHKLLKSNHFLSCIGQGFFSLFGQATWHKEYFTHNICFLNWLHIKITACTSRRH